MARITINGISVDPIAEARSLASAGLEATEASESDYILVQTEGPLTDEQRTSLTDLGVVIHEYVPENTYVCGYEPTDLNAIRGLPFVVWANVYLEGFKIPRSLRSSPSAVASVLPVTARPALSRKPHQVEVVLHRDVDPTSDPVRQRVAQAAGVDPDGVESSERKIRLTADETQLASLAALDEVRHIEEVPERQLFNNVARQIINADVVVNGTPYEGRGEIVAVADTGFDQGSVSDVHPAFTGRVAQLYALGRDTLGHADDPDGHGTHVAGSVLGDGNSASMGGAIRGTAPQADLVLQSLLDTGGGLGGIPFDLHHLFEPPYSDDGARVHTNSWGAIIPGLPYDASAEEIDDVVWHNPDLIICFAAGNDGTDANDNGIVDAGQVGSQAAAKNCITVGASESERPEFEPSYGFYWPDDFPADPVASDQQADDPRGLVAFSSRGPTQEGRIKPDVVAPGSCILSALSRSVATMPTVFGESTDPLYSFSSGTSMATPLVAGCVAVLRETLVQNGSPNPSAALIKSMLINGADELAGQYAPTEAGASPNNNSGFGRVNLARSIILPGTPENAGFGEGGPLEQGDEDTIGIEIPEVPPDGDEDEIAVQARLRAGNVLFKVTLVWSDPAGAALQNDLDLIVRASDGQERHGNMGLSDDFDRLNNVEQVLWTPMPPGAAEIVIRAHRITNLPQPYAYAWRIS